MRRTPEGFYQYRGALTPPSREGSLTRLTRHAVVRTSTPDREAKKSPTPFTRIPANCSRITVRHRSTGKELDDVTIANSQELGKRATNPVRHPGCFHALTCPCSSARVIRRQHDAYSNSSRRMPRRTAIDRTHQRSSHWLLRRDRTIVRAAILHDRSAGSTEAEQSTRRAARAAE